MIDFTDPSVLKVLWAAMCSMTQDIHCPESNLTKGEWEVADQLFAQLNEIQDAKAGV